MSYTTLRRTNFNITDRNMSFLHLVFCCSLTIYSVSDGRIVQGIIGQNVSLSWTFRMLKHDIVCILHNGSLIHRFLTHRNQSFPLKPPQRGFSSVYYTMPENITVTIHILNLTENDAGTYRVKRQWKLKDLDNRIDLQMFAHVYPSDGRTVQGINGRTVSLSWTYRDMNDYVVIFHGSAPVVWFFYDSQNYYIPKKQQDRLQPNAETFANNTVTYTINITNVTRIDAGEYKVGRLLDSETFNDCIVLEIIDESFIPRIEMIRYNSSESSIYLQCRSSSAFTDKVLWKLNGSLVENRNRYSQSKNIISITNLTASDCYNLYTCGELGMQFESDPYRLRYGPKEIFFNAVDNAHEVNGLETVVRFCYANCFPPCDIVWINTNGDTMIHGAELKLVNLTIDVNYTCQATNPINSKAKIFKTIFIKVKSGANYSATMSTVDDKEGTGAHHKTTMSEVDDKERTGYTKSHNPTIRHLLFTALGIGVLLAVGISSFLLYKRRACLRADSPVNRVRDNVIFLTSHQSAGRSNIYSGFPLTTTLNQ